MVLILHISLAVIDIVIRGSILCGLGYVKVIIIAYITSAGFAVNIITYLIL